MFYDRKMIEVEAEEFTREAGQEAIARYMSRIPRVEGEPEKTPREDIEIFGVKLSYTEGAGFRVGDLPVAYGNYIVASRKGHPTVVTKEAFEAEYDVHSSDGSSGFRESTPDDGSDDGSDEDLDPVVTPESQQ